jgi:hypothetical protein
MLALGKFKLGLAMISSNYLQLLPKRTKMSGILAILKRFRFHILLKTFTKCYYRYNDLMFKHNSTIKDLTRKGYFPFIILWRHMIDKH